MMNSISSCPLAFFPPTIGFAIQLWRIRFVVVTAPPSKQNHSFCPLSILSAHYWFCLRHMMQSIFLAHHSFFLPTIGFAI